MCANQEHKPKNLDANTSQHESDSRRPRQQRNGSYNDPPTCRQN
jgi:hypothetical protein